MTTEHTPSSDGTPRLNPAAMTVEDAAKLLTRAGGVRIFEAQIRKDIEANAPTNTDGAMVRIDRCLIDANWGASTDVLLPSHGRYVGASSIPFSEYKRKRGNRVGHNWRIPNVAGKRAVRHVVFDTNYWKSLIHARLAVPMGDPGCLALFGRKPEPHRLLAEHLTAEYRVKTEGRGRTVDEWKLRQPGLDNHWLDCVVGVAVAASMQGTVLYGISTATPPIQRIKLSALRGGQR